MIRKAVIPAAGFGTRMLPAAKAVAKELLPIVDRPVLQHIVEELASAGLSEATIVTSPTKTAIQTHFSDDPRLAAKLASGNKAALLQSLIDLRKVVQMSYVDQLEQLGLGHAVLCAKEKVGNEAFLCMLGDAVFSGDLLPAMQMTQIHNRFGGSVIGLEEVSPEKVERYGIVGGKEVEPGVFRLDQLVEKPKRDVAPSRLAIAARYILSPAIFDCLEQTQKDKSGEIQLTDGLQRLLAREPIHGVVLKARRHDVGNPIDWLKTNLIFARRDEKTWSALRSLLDELMK